MTKSLARIALIGSLRSRIVIVIALMAVAVQLANYSIVEGANKEFHATYEESALKQIQEIVPPVVNAEFKAMQYQALSMSNELIELGRTKSVSDAISLMDRQYATALSEVNRYLLLAKVDGQIVFSGNSAVDKALAHPADPVDTGDIVDAGDIALSGLWSSEESFLLATSTVNIAGQNYSLMVASSIEKNMLPAIERLSRTSSKVVSSAENSSSAAANLALVQIPHFPTAQIESAYRGAPVLDNLVVRQESQLKLLLAFSLLVVLFLGMALANELTKPLKLLVEATKKIRFGDYSVVVPTMQGDEIGELAETIDSMRQRIGEREEEILKLAYADALTELPNRALFDDRLNASVARGQHKDERFAVVILDLNRFKYINDVLGHESGDFVLKEVANRLKTTLRPYDTVARLGGDEFALLLQDVEDEAINAAVTRIEQAFEEPVTLNNQPIDIGCSIGVAKFPEHGEDASTLLRRADMAMYSAKRLDASFAFYAPDLDEHREEHLSLLGELKRAIELDELQLFFQPKITLGDTSVLSVETLIRWQHPTRGLIPPNEFIPFAEHTGAIRLVTRWLITKALLQASSWGDEGLDIKMSVNISTRDLLDPDFSGFVSKRLKENNVEPEMICMEITESALMQDPVRARRTVEELHNLGVSISIDDYGTGYSSLAYVKNLPVNELKIDREFIKNMINNKQDIAIVRSTIELGHNLGLKVVAEGIEREEEMQMLKEFGCDQAQGYLISKALTASDMEAWISDNRTLPTDFNRPNVLRSVGKS